MRLCTYTPVALAGVTTHARDSASSVTRPRTTRPAPETTLRRIYWDDGVPAIAQAPPFLDPTYGTGYIPTNATGAQNPTYGDPVTGGKPPYYENWNFGVQRALTGTMTLGVAYTASIGKFLPGPENGSGSPLNTTPLQYLALGPLLTATANAANIASANAITPGIALPFSNFTGTIGQMLRPFPQYGTISSPWFDVGQSSYQGSPDHVQSPVFQGPYLHGWLHVQQGTGQSGDHPPEPLQLLPGKSAGHYRPHAT